MCHTVAPHLNTFGMAFQANHFNWPGDGAPQRKADLLPLSALATASREENHSERHTSADFRTAEVFASDMLRVGRGGQGGYFLNAVAASKGDEAPAGDLDSAYVAIPVAGRRGETALVVGQFSPLLYQWDAVNSLTDSMPAALGDPVGDVSLTDAAPGIRLEYFSRRRQGTADGNYLSLEAPFQGHLTLQHVANIGSRDGLLLHGFVRSGMNTCGALAYVHGGSHLAALIVTREVSPGLNLTAAAVHARDPDGASRRVSAQVDYLMPARLAFTARLDWLGGASSDLAPAAAITYYPLSAPMLRLTAEAVQRKGDRLLTIFARAQF